MTNYDYPGVNVNGNHPGIAMTDHQLAQVVGDQFGGKANTPTAIAIIIAESGGDAFAKNPKTNPNYFGLWQISKSAHPDLIKPYTGDDTNNPYDPDVNTHMALAVYKNAGNKFTPWQTYTDGTYKKYLSRGQKASDSLARTGAEVAAENPGPSQSNAIDKALTTGKNVVDALNPANWLSWIAKAFTTAGIFILAIILFVVGVWMLIPADKRPDPSDIPIPVPV